LLIGVGLFLFYQCVRKGHEARLAESLEVSSCGRAQEGLLKITGRVASAASIRSPLMELPCVITQAEAAVFQKRAKKKWKQFFSATQNTPFYVEDGTGRLWVDPREAELFLLADVEFSTKKKWKPKPKQLTRYGEMELTAELLGQRLRSFYEQRTGQEAGRKALRFSEKTLMVGDLVTVMGPAYAVTSSESEAGQIRIHRVHPDDPFVIGDGAPEELAARMRKQVWWTRVGGFACIAVGAAMVASCYFGRRG
jgi:hypothetical protein